MTSEAARMAPSRLCLPLLLLYIKGEQTISVIAQVQHLNVLSHLILLCAFTLKHWQCRWYFKRKDESKSEELGAGGVVKEFGEVHP